MNLNYEKDSETKDILVKILSFVIYFIAAGFISKLTTVFVYPVLGFFTKYNPDLEDIILYFISIAAMFAVLSFFAVRDSFHDAEFLKFPKSKSIIFSHFAATFIFCLVFGVLKIIYITPGENIVEYFTLPYFPPQVITEFLLYMPVIGDACRITQNYIYMNEDIFFFILTMIINTLFITIFYKIGRLIWKKGINLES